ncbi:MAG TPA: DoxX family protein [Terriglobia bacterium]|nr:DoxX family protein [Terriglobia bacterium]
MLARLVKTNEDYVVLALRLALGVMILPHGAQKLLGWFGGYGFHGTMQFFTQTMGIPALFALLAIIAEFFGGLGLISGLLGRVAALAVAANMAVAVALVHARYGFFMNWFGNQKGEGFEFHLLALAIAAAIMVRGSGAWSLDRLLSRKSEPAQTASELRRELSNSAA